MVSSSKDIAINYLRTWFFLDLVAALPFDLFDLISDLMVNIHLIVFQIRETLKSQKSSNEVFQKSYESVHLLKLIRLLRLATLVAKVDRCVYQNLK